MAADGRPGRGSDQFPLRLPDGMRERIKAYADRHGRSMNAEIVRVLEREFPAPVSLAERVQEILGLVSSLKEAEDLDVSVHALGFEIFETLTSIADGRIGGVDAETRARIKERLADWQADQAEKELDRYTATMDDEEIKAVERGEHPFKF